MKVCSTTKPEVAKTLASDIKILVLNRIKLELGEFCFRLIDGVPTRSLNVVTLYILLKCNLDYLKVSLIIINN